MDASVQKEGKMSVLWRPEIRGHGRAEIGVNRWNDELGRYVLDSVPVEEYLRMWAEGHLMFQAKFGGKPFDKPRHYPTPEQAEEYLEWRAEEDAKKEHEQELMLSAREEPVVRERLVPPPVVEEVEEEPPPAPRPQIDWAKHATKKNARADTPAPKPTEKETPPPPVEFDLDASAKLYNSLSKRDKELVEAALEGKRLEGVNENSLKTRLSGLCTEIGLPKVTTHGGQARLEMLKNVQARFNKLCAEGQIVPEQSLVEQRVEILRATVQALHSENPRRLVKPSKLFARVAADYPGGIKATAWSNFFYTRLSEQQRAAIFQAHHEAMGKRPSASSTPKGKSKPKTPVDPTVLNRYQKAATDLRSSGLAVTPASLAKRLDMSEGMMKVFLSVHPDFENYE